MNTNEDIVIRLRFNGDKWLNFYVFNFTGDVLKAFGHMFLLETLSSIIFIIIVL